MPEDLSETRRITLGSAMAQLPGGDGQRFATLFRHGTLLVEIYAPLGTDPQQPHTRDEVYVVAQGNGEFIAGDLRVSFAQGDFLFAPAGEIHRFENFSDDLAVWVLFYGPESGEADSKT
jgi:mannose-6-phosphate isomerase-like protein (cupin superfamily)